MKIKAVVPGTVPGSTDSVPERLMSAFGGQEFARRVLVEIIGERLGVERVLERSGEYYVQKPDEMVLLEGAPHAVVVTVSGVSRNGRKAKQFHEAHGWLLKIVHETIEGIFPFDEKADVQYFVVMQLDDQIELKPGSGTYGTQLEWAANVRFTGEPADRLSTSSG